jgi:hypothetical protein
MTLAERKDSDSVGRVEPFIPAKEFDAQRAK